MTSDERPFSFRSVALAAFLPTLLFSIGEGAIIRMGDALAAMPKPMFGYCRSGGRAGSLYAAALKAARR